MRVFKLAAAGAIAVSMIAATSATAAEPMRSLSALPAGSMVTAKNFRTATPLKNRSNQSDGTSPAVGYVLAAVMGAGIIAATIAATDDDSKTPPSSPG
jgi:hypothetical protein